MDIFSKIAATLEDHASEIKKYDHSFQNFNFHTRGGESLSLDTTQELSSPLDNFIPEFSHNNLSDKKEKLQSLARHHSRVAKKHIEKEYAAHENHIKERLATNDDNLLKQMSYLEMFYLTMSESEQTKMEQSIFNIINDTNELTKGDIINMPMELLSFVSKDEIQEILDTAPDEPTLEQEKKPSSSNDFSLKIEPTP